jgi:membrane-associated phospholipid phosphatase
MLAAREANLAGGAGWIAANGGSHITVGLAAMPSLHTGGAFLFLLFAWRHARVLVPVYAPLFAFIAIDAVASRWHYLVDLPAGIALALACAWAAERLNPASADRPVQPQSPRPDFLAGLIGRLRGRLGPAKVAG